MQRINPKNQFNLVMLGTDTIIESVNKDDTINRMANYERGETLNAIFRELKGEEFKDKHIVSGANTTGESVDQKAAEGLLMVLKAISEGKNDIRIAAHSRGAIEVMLLCHKLQNIKNLLEESPGKFKEELTKIVKSQSDKNNNTIECLKKKIKSKRILVDLQELESSIQGNMEMSFQNINEHHSFQTIQEKTTAGSNDNNFPVEIFDLDIDKIKEKLNENFNLELFLMDPVPGQKLLQDWTSLLSSWHIDEFHKLPSIVDKAEIIYQLHERTNFFQAAFVEKTSEKQQLKVKPLPGHHGTASGFLIPQSEEPDIIKKDKKEKIGSQFETYKTRHVQKIAGTSLIDFFGEEQFSSDANKTKKELDKLPEIENNIHLYLKKNDIEREKYKIRMYDKIGKNQDSYKKFLKTTYKNLAFLSSASRSILMPNGEYKSIEDIPELATPPDGFVNDEHFQLKIKMIGRFIEDALNKMLKTDLLDEGTFQPYIDQAKDFYQEVNLLLQSLSNYSENYANKHVQHAKILVKQIELSNHDLHNRVKQIIGSAIDGLQSQLEFNLDDGYQANIDTISANNASLEILYNKIKEIKEIKEIKDASLITESEWARYQDTLKTLRRNNRNMISRVHEKCRGYWQDQINKLSNASLDMLHEGNWGELLLKSQELHEGIHSHRDNQFLDDKHVDELTSQIERINALVNDYRIKQASLDELTNIVSELNTTLKITTAHEAFKTRVMKNIADIHQLVAVTDQYKLENAASPAIRRQIVDQCKLNLANLENLSTLKKHKQCTTLSNDIKTDIAELKIDQQAYSDHRDHLKIDYGDLITELRLKLENYYRSNSNNLSDQAKQDILNQRDALQDQLQLALSQIDLHINNIQQALDKDIKALEDIDQQVEKIRSKTEHSYEFQQARIETLIAKFQVKGSPESKLLQTLSKEIKSLHKQQAEPDDRLAKTLRIACDATNSMRFDGHHLDDLSREAHTYLKGSKNSRSSHRKIGACLIGLSAVLMLATVAFSVITFGTALLPMATLSAGIIAGVAGTAATAIAPIGAYSLFKSKEPKIAKSIKKYNEYYNKSLKPDNRSDD